MSNIKRRYNEELENELVGKRYGHLVVTNLLWNKQKRRRIAQCKCDCGNDKFLPIGDLCKVKRCGYKCSIKLHSQRVDIAGQKFGRLTAIKISQHQNKTDATFWDCECECGNIKAIRISSLRNGATQSCGCINKATGENHFNWKPELTAKYRSDKRVIFEGRKYKKWRDAVRDRDKVCQITGLKNNTRAHHIYSFSSNPELRFEVNNGIILHDKIHKLFHSYFGNGKNTPEQLEEFIKWLYMWHPHDIRLNHDTISKRWPDIYKEARIEADLWNNEL